MFLCCLYQTFDPNSHWSIFWEELNLLNKGNNCECIFYITLILPNFLSSRSPMTSVSFNVHTHSMPLQLSLSLTLLLSYFFSLISSLPCYSIFIFWSSSLFISFSTDTRELLGEMDGIDVLLQQLSVRLFQFALKFYNFCNFSLCGGALTCGSTTSSVVQIIVQNPFFIQEVFWYQLLASVISIFS